MSTPQYDLLKANVRDWANKRESATVPDGVIEACIRYGQDLIYRNLRVPQLEHTTKFTVLSENNAIEDDYTVIDVPQDLIEFIYLRRIEQTSGGKGIIYNQVPDVRTFFDPYAEQYGRNRYVWKDLQIYIYPKLEEGDRLELHYYRRLAPVNALYSVVAENYNILYPENSQPLLELSAEEEDGTTLYFVTRGSELLVFNTSAEQVEALQQGGGDPTTADFVGKEAWNWLRDAQEWMLLFATMSFAGAYLFDDSMENKYLQRTMGIIEMLNREDKFRKAKGGNIQMNVNTGGLI
jgi:hypothetical protein